MWNITVDIWYTLEHCPAFAVIREMCSKKISKEMFKISNEKNIIGIAHSFVCTQFSGSCNQQDVAIIVVITGNNKSIYPFSNDG